MNQIVNAQKNGESLSAPRITVAICTYNRYQMLRDLVATLANQNLPMLMFEVLIIDNTDNEADRQLFAKEVHGWPGLEVLYSFPPNLSRARNAAIENCRTEYIAFIDDDAFPSVEWLTSILNAFNKSGASVVAGPIEPVWPGPQPDWIPSKYVGCLTVLDHGAVDRNLSEYEFAYGANMAYKVSALREIGGFNVALGRAGNTLISDEDIEPQIALRARGHKVFYAAAAKVFHRVHENRLSRNYFRARMAWQAVSVLMHDSPFIWLEQSRKEVIRASFELGIGDFAQRLFAGKDPVTFSAQIDLIYHLFLLILNSKDQDDAIFEQQFTPAADALGLTSANTDGAVINKSLPDVYSPTAAIGPNTRHLFVEGKAGHAFLFDTYAGIPGSQMVTLNVFTWDKCDKDLQYLEKSLTPQLQTLTFLTLEPFVYGASSSSFFDMLDRVDIPLFGILHRPPSNDNEIAALRLAASRIGVIVLSEIIANQLRDAYGIPSISYLPLHAIHQIYLGQDCDDTREFIGAKPGQVVFSILGEARNGKGIELLMAALTRLSKEDRDQAFFLFCGRSKDIDADDVKRQLVANKCNGYVDLRKSADPLNYAVLSEREFGQYANVTDVGVLLYQFEQRYCMSGVLPNYVWAYKLVIATADSVAGQMVEKYDLGMILKRETPQDVANAIAAALRVHRAGRTHSEAYESFRATLSPEAVIQRLSFILNNTDSHCSGHINNKRRGGNHG